MESKGLDLNNVVSWMHSFDWVVLAGLAGIRQGKDPNGSTKTECQRLCDAMLGLQMFAVWLLFLFFVLAALKDSCNTSMDLGRPWTSLELRGFIEGDQRGSMHSCSLHASNFLWKGLPYNLSTL